MNNLEQQGAVLIIGLLMLTVMTLLAVSSMQSSSLQELMSNNMSDKVTAFEAAESAIRAAEEFLSGDGALNLGAFDENRSDGLLANIDDEIWNLIDWPTESIEVDSVVIDADEKGGVRSKPRFVVQYIGPVVPEASSRLNVDNAYGNEATDSIVEMFKITARGTGGSDNTVVVLESMYGVSN